MTLQILPFKFLLNDTTCIQILLFKFLFNDTIPILPFKFLLNGTILDTLASIYFPALSYDLEHFPATTARTWISLPATIGCKQVLVACWRLCHRRYISIQKHLHTKYTITPDIRVLGLLSVVQYLRSCPINNIHIYIYNKTYS